MDNIVEQTLNIPKKFRHVAFLRASYKIFVFALPIYLILWFINLGSFSNSQNLMITIFGVLAGFALFVSLILYVIGMRVKTSGYEKFKSEIKVWAEQKYSMDLTPADLARLSEPKSYAKEQNVYISESLETWVQDPAGRKSIRHISLVETDDYPILFCFEEGNEVESVQYRHEVDFFQSLWREVDRNGAIFSLMKNNDFISKYKDGKKVCLFWSDPLRVQLYESSTEFEMVAIHPQKWAEEVLPVLAAQEINVGLNWGEEEKVYTPNHISRLVLL